MIHTLLVIGLAWLDASLVVGLGWSSLHFYNPEDNQ